MSDYTIATLDDIPRRDDTWIPIRRHLDIAGFGVNAQRAAAVGGRLINEHTEVMDKHEELYVVVDGHATFTLDGNEVDAPAGTLVFVDWPTQRSAVAKAAGTTVLVAGARAGHAYEVAPWEESAEENDAAMKLYREERYAEAADVLREAVTRYPDSSRFWYNLACFDCMAGADVATVTGSLRRAIELHPGFGGFAQADSDLDRVRDEPAFQALVGTPEPHDTADGPGYQVARLDEIEQWNDGRCPYQAVGIHFGIRAFGANAWTAAGAGDRIINEHDESEPNSDEELYVVLHGHATFELDGERVDAPAGALVFVRPGVSRTAFAEEAGTSILVLGGKPGMASEQVGWQIWAPVRSLYEAGEYDQVVERGRELIEAHPGYPIPLYNLACCESLAGRNADAVGHLRQAIELSDRFREFAQGDSDLDAIRDEPGYKELMQSPA